MTIDVGYAHLRLPDGDVLDFRRRAGHDRLVGNMLVGAAEIDAVLLVVAADDGRGPRRSSTSSSSTRWGCATRWSRSRRSTPWTRLGWRWSGRWWRHCSRRRRSPGLRRSPCRERRGWGSRRWSRRSPGSRDRARADGAGATGPARLAVDRVFGVKGGGRW